jgi:hypothetical protein
VLREVPSEWSAFPGEEITQRAPENAEVVCASLAAIISGVFLSRAAFRAAERRLPAVAAAVAAASVAIPVTAVVVASSQAAALIAAHWARRAAGEVGAEAEVEVLHDDSLAALRDAVRTIKRREKQLIVDRGAWGRFAHEASAALTDRASTTSMIVTVELIGAVAVGVLSGIEMFTKVKDEALARLRRRSGAAAASPAARALVLVGCGALTVLSGYAGLALTTGISEATRRLYYATYRGIVAVPHPDFLLPPTNDAYRFMRLPAHLSPWELLRMRDQLRDEFPEAYRQLPAHILVRMQRDDATKQ